jgi:predicted dehydrogenase
VPHLLERRIIHHLIIYRPIIYEESPVSHNSEQSGATEPLHVAVVGVGKVAVQNYLPALVKDEHVRLSYYNRTPEKALAAARQFGGEAVATVDALMAGDPDTVLVLTRETTRAEITDELLAHAPKRLFFEKPLVAASGQAAVQETDFWRGRELWQRAEAGGTTTAMVFNYRFFEQTQKARELIAAYELGAPVHFTGLVHYACWSHAVDLVLDFMGPVESISALADRRAGPCMGSDNVQNVSVTARMENEAVGTLIGTCAIDFKLPLYELTLAFANGRIHLRDLDGDLEVINYRTRRHEVHALPRDVSRWDQYRASFGKSLDAYLASIRAGTPPPVPGVAGVRELQFEAGIKRSLAMGRPVTLAEELPVV